MATDVTLDVPSDYNMTQALDWVEYVFDAFRAHGWTIEDVWSLDIGTHGKFKFQATRATEPSAASSE